MSNYYDPGTGNHVVVDGMIVERDALRVAEAIREYDENLVVLCVDPSYVEGISEEPFVIAERDDAGVLHPVLRAWTLDGTVLERLYYADNKKFNTMDTLLNIEQQAKRDNQSRYREFREEAKDIVAHIAGMGSKYSVRDSNSGELITFYDDRPTTRK